FGRLRAAHSSLLLFGCGSLVPVGHPLCVVSRPSRVPLWRPHLARIALWLWNLALLGGLVTLLAGVNRGPQEYREWVWPLAVILATAGLIAGFVAYRPVAALKLPDVYVVNWSLCGGVCYLQLIYDDVHVPVY